jgi:hypothetical protein
VSDRDEGRHVATGAGAPADPGTRAPEEVTATATARRAAGRVAAGAVERPAGPAGRDEADDDVLQAVVDFVGDLVDDVDGDAPAVRAGEGAGAGRHESG